jgi:hypothetical protein
MPYVAAIRSHAPHIYNTLSSEFDRRLRFSYRTALGREMDSPSYHMDGSGPLERVYKKEIEKEKGEGST